MGKSASLLKAITTVYAAPGSNAGWEKALGEVAKLSGGAAGSYLLIDEQARSIELGVTHGYPRELFDQYMGVGEDQDIRLRYVHLLVPGIALRESEYCPDMNAYVNSQWIKTERERFGLLWNLAARISTHGLWADVISVVGLESRGPFNTQDKLALEAVLPHLSRAAELHRTVTRLENAYGAVLAVLDKLLVGLIILDTKGRTVLANTAARAAMHDTGALRLTANSRICATDGAKDGQLQRLITLTAQSVQNAGTNEGGQLTLASRRPGEQLLVEVMPIRDDSFPDGDNIRGVAVFLVDPNRAHLLNAEGLAQIFSLSLAESAITKALINGSKPRAIAEERRTTFETVRSQIKSIYRKTGTASESDLVRLAAKADPPIERN